MDQTFKKTERLKSSERISELFQKGGLAKKGFLILRFAPNDLRHHRIAFSVPKRRVASAVKRNLIKRRLREVYRLHKAELDATWPEQKMDLVLLYLAEEAKDYSRMEANFKKLLSQLHNA